MVRGAHAQQQRSSSNFDLLSHRAGGSGATGAPPRPALDTRIRGLAGARDVRHPPGRRSLRWIALSQCAVDSGRRSEDQRGSGDLENGLALSCRLAGLSDRAGRGSRAWEARIGSRHLTELTAISAESRSVFCLARPAAAGRRHVSTEVVRQDGKRNGVPVLVSCGSYRYLAYFLTQPHAPQSPRPSPHSAGQPQAKKSVRSLNQPSLPRLWPLPSTDPCRPGTWRTLQQGWGSFLSPEHVPLSLSHSPWKSRHRLDSLLTERGPGDLTCPDKYKVIITGLHLLGELYLLPPTLSSSYDICVHLLCLAPYGPFSSIIDAPF